MCEGAHFFCEIRAGARIFRGVKVFCYRGHAWGCWGMCGGGHVWWGVWRGGGMRGGGHAWQGGMRGRGVGECMTKGGMHGRGACVAGGVRATADTTGYGQ